jgi:hypothetical protein
MLNSMRPLLIVILVGTMGGSAAFAQADPPDDLVLDNLREWLMEAWHEGSFTELGYNQARIQMYSFVDSTDEGMIPCIYTGFSQEAAEVTYLNPINAEHVVPQSFFGGAGPLKSDIYNLRPCHGSANSARGNSPFGDVANGQAQWYGITSSGGYTSQSNAPSDPDSWSERSGGIWEPREEFKGDLARQVFYGYTMYPDELGDITGMGISDTLLAWHLADPVSGQELVRTDRIETAQGNRNPFVDFPVLVYRAWFYTGEGCMYADACNFDPAATTEDGSCEYTSCEVLGCMYAWSPNYNPDATQDDGTCMAGDGSGGCLEDITGDGLVTVSDLLQLLSAFGEACVG